MGKITLMLHKLSEDDNYYNEMAKYLLNCDDILNLTVNTLCDECYVSIAAPTRLSKKLGLNGFGELKFTIESERNKTNSSQFSISEYQTQLNESLGSSLSMLSDEKLLEVVAYMCKAKKINIFSVGGTNIVAQDFAFKMERLNKWMTCFSDEHLQSVHAKNANNTTLCIGISYSGLTKEVIGNLKIAKENNAMTVLITSSDANFDYIDSVIKVECQEETYRKYSTISRTILLSICDALYLKYLHLDEAIHQDMLRRTIMHK